MVIISEITKLWFDKHKVPSLQRKRHERKRKHILQQFKPVQFMRSSRNTPINDPKVCIAQLLITSVNVSCYMNLCYYYYLLIYFYN